MTTKHRDARRLLPRRAPTGTITCPEDTTHAIAAALPGRPRGHVGGLGRSLRCWLRSEEHRAACPRSSGFESEGHHLAPAALAGRTDPQAGHGRGCA